MNVSHPDTMATSVIHQAAQNNEPSSYEHEQGQGQEAWIVDFEKSDPENPKSFRSWYKVFVTFQMSMLAFSGSLGSSIVSPAQSDIEGVFNVSSEVASLTLSLFVLGRSCFSVSRN